MNDYNIRNILVPVDLSETSLNALETAVALAKKHKASLHILFVNEKRPGYNDSVYEQYSSNINSDVLSAITLAIKHNHELLPNVIEIEGNVTERIVSMGSRLTADLIVMGTHGASGYRSGFIGTNTYNTIKYSTCPVLTIPPGRKITGFRKVLFPIRPISGALSEYGGIRNFFSVKTAVDVLGFSYKGEGETSLLEKLISEAKKRADWSEAEMKPFWGALPHIPESVLQHTIDLRTDLLILTSLLDTVVKPAYIGPHAQKLIHSAKVPVLNIKRAIVPLAASIIR